MNTNPQIKKVTTTSKKSGDQSWKQFGRSLLLLITILGTFFVLVLSSTLSFNQINPNQHYHVVLTTSKGYADSGFNQQAVESICLKYATIENKGKTNCDYTRSEFAEHASYGYAGTTDNPLKIYNYIINIHKNQGIKNFILPGYNFTDFLNKYIRELEKMSINIISIDTYYQHSTGTSKPTNLYQISYLHYYAGYHAGLYTGAFALKNSSKFEDGDPNKEGKQILFASVVGKSVAAILNYVFGFKLGLEQAAKLKNHFKDNKETETTIELVHNEYEEIGGFDPVANGDKTKFIAKKLYDKKVSIIFVVAGSLTKNVGTVAYDINKNSKFEHYVVGVDVDQGVIYFGESKDSVKYRDDDKQKAITVTSATISLRSSIKYMMEKISENKDNAGTYSVHGHENTNNEELGTIPKRFRNHDNIWSTIKSKIGSSKEKLIKLLNSEAKVKEAGVKESKDSNKNFIDQIVDKASKWAPPGSAAAQIVTQRKKQFIALLKKDTSNLISDTKSKNNSWI